MEAAGLPPEWTLSQLWAEGRHSLPSGPHGQIRLLGMQSQLVGAQRVASLLLMRSTPSLILPQEAVSLLQSLLMPNLAADCPPALVAEWQDNKRPEILLSTSSRAHRTPHLSCSLYKLGAIVCIFRWREQSTLAS